MNESKFQGMVILVLILGFIVLGFLIRTQNMSMAELTQSVAQVSSSVFDIVKEKKEGIIQTGEKVGARIGNPASQNCLTVGGKWTLEDGPAGQYGVCTMGDGRACEEWALYNGECPAEGVDISDYTEQADRYCALTGHEVVAAGTEESSGICKINGEECLSESFLVTGRCTSKEE